MRHLVPVALCASFAVPLARAAQHQQPTALPVAVPVPPTNVLLVVADDLGCDMVGSFGQHPSAPPTPTLDALAATGVSFVSAYTDPLCSPSRACILTGRYAFRTGLGTAIQTNLPEFELLAAERTLPEIARMSATPVWASAIGKWHLNSILSGPSNPNQQGFAYFAGTEGNFFFGQSYTSHAKVTNGVYAQSSTYATTEQVDDALARIQAMPEPWFLYLAFNASHQPFHAPPSNLHGYSLSGNPDATPELHFRAAVQAMDTELGRLLATMDPLVRARTTVIFLGDNGSPNEAVLPPTAQGVNKGTLFEGGVHVPLIVAGPRVRHPGSRCYSLVNSVDLFSTVLELLDVPYAPPTNSNSRIDGRSLLPYLAQPWCSPLRSSVFACKFAPNGFGPYTSYARMLRSARWKLVQRAGQGDSFYDMASAAGDTYDLLTGTLTPQQQSAYARLQIEIDELVTN